MLQLFRVVTSATRITRTISISSATPIQDTRNLLLVYTVLPLFSVSYYNFPLSSVYLANIRPYKL